jgi:ectoine hydroxylase-related dioxygenase (phytanoyl-CoA dioxygenase family)
MESRISLPDDPCASVVMDESTLQSAIEKFDRSGALWIENLLSPKFVDELNHAYTKRYAQLSKKKLKQRYAKVGDGRYMISVKVKPPFDSVALSANPVLLPLLKHFLGDNCVISSFGSVVSFPGADAQPVHFDYPPLFESESTCNALPPHAVTLVVPLVNLDARTGSTAIWEGSHRASGNREQLRHLRDCASLEGSVLPMPNKGDVYLMDFRVIHAGTANISNLARPILYIVYTRPWFHEDANFPEQRPIELSRKRFKKLTKPQRKLFARALASD